MKLWLVGVFCVGMTLASAAVPQPASAYTVRGAGKCSTWVGGTDDRFWILGFISGNNYAKNANSGRGVEVDSIYRFVTRYCQQNAGDDLADAATAYLKTN